MPRVAILDPATGTGSFLAEIIRYVKDTYFSGGREAFYKNYILDDNGLLSRLIGFEIMMTSYVVAHLQLRRTISDTLSHIPDEAPVTNIFMTNTLAMPQTQRERNEQTSLFDLSAAISDEAYHADTWKTRRPIKVIIGNPPYLAASSNSYDISAYKTETDGITGFGEKKHGLSNDYVYFYHFAEQIINKNSEGVLAFVSDNSFLFRTTFRGMRASLLRTFSKIYIINLHGNANNQETAPDGGKDENIFDIMQGVTLFIGVKTDTSEDWAKVYYADLWGTREQKFQSLTEKDFAFTEIDSINKRMAYLIPINGNNNNASQSDIYETGLSVTEIFGEYVCGIQTNNDDAAVALTRVEIERRIETVKSAVAEDPIRELWKKFSRGQTAQSIQNDVLSTEGVITPEIYRPFDNRWTYYSGISCGWTLWPREKKKMRHFLKTPTSPIGQNVGLVFARGAPPTGSFAMIFITDKIFDHSMLSTQSSTYAYSAPLYLYDDINDSWSPNFDPDSLSQLTENMSFKPEPIEVFDYIYGILYDPVYRERFNEFLKRDFPRVPIINGENRSDNFYVSEEMFRAYVTAGEHLRKLHLMQEKVPAQLSIEPNNSDDMEIGAVKYKDGILYINANKQILGIAQDVWEYRIGGYQVLDKWLKSHKGETLTIDSFDHICNVAGLLAETIKIQESLREMHSAT